MFSHFDNILFNPVGIYVAFHLKMKAKLDCLQHRDVVFGDVIRKTELRNMFNIDAIISCIDLFTSGAI